MDRFASTNSSSCASLLLSTDKDLLKYAYHCYQTRIFGELLFSDGLETIPRPQESGPYSHISIALEAAEMSQRQPNYWDASDDSDTDAADAANLAEQPESIDEHKRVDIYFPELQRIKPRKLNQLKTDLRNKFNVSEIEENSRTCVLSVSGYGFDHEDVLREVRRYDSKAS